MNTEDTVVSDIEALVRNLELPYLKKIQRQLESEIKKREDRSLTDAIAEIHKIAAKVGMKAEDLLQIKHNVKPAKPVQHVPVKYQHNTKPELKWTGRGRQPQWVKDWLKEGRKLEALAV